MSDDRRAEILKILDDQNHLSERADTKRSQCYRCWYIHSLFCCSIKQYENEQLFDRSCGNLFCVSGSGDSTDNFSYQSAYTFC